MYFINEILEMSMKFAYQDVSEIKCTKYSKVMKISSDFHTSQTLYKYRVCIAISLAGYAIA